MKKMNTSKIIKFAIHGSDSNHTHAYPLVPETIAEAVSMVFYDQFNSEEGAAKAVDFLLSAEKVAKNVFIDNHEFLVFSYKGNKLFVSFEQKVIVVNTVWGYQTTNPIEEHLIGEFSIYNAEDAFKYQNSALKHLGLQPTDKAILVSSNQDLHGFYNEDLGVRTLAKLTGVTRKIIKGLRNGIPLQVV